MISPKIPLAKTIISSLRAQNIKHIVISPGSRNAPLTLGFVQHDFFTCYSIVDERCAAFFALGIAQQLREPVAVLCTSGSALLNYYPAIAEAFYSQIPLIVLSADRPFDKIDIGDGQTIRQANVFENHILESLNLAQAPDKETPNVIQKAILKAKRYQGPVHINIPFEEPLYETELLEDDFDATFDILSSEEKTISDEIDFSDFADIWNRAPKKLILLGVMRPGEITQEMVDFWASDPSILVMTEATSNVFHDHFIDQIDTLITPFDDALFSVLQPDVLLTMGGMIVSKRVKSFLRIFKPAAHWHVDSLRAYDTYGCLTHFFQQKPNVFFEKIIRQKVSLPSDYQSFFIKIKKDRILKQEAYLKNAPFSDLKVFELMHKHLPKSVELQVGNSSPIRYMQLFPAVAQRNVFCNRGTSGIDGSTSTAIGAAVATQKTTLCITGDVSFFYDSNALWNQYIPKNFKLILINNGGGGIFRILPGHEEKPVFNDFFETGHCFTGVHLAQMYGFKYLTASSEDTFVNAMEMLFSDSNQPAILEVFTPTKINDSVLKLYFNSL